MAKSPTPIDTIVSNFADPDYKVRSEVVRQLSKSRHPDAVDYLIRALDDQTISVKRLAIRGLGKFKDPRAIKPIIRMLAHKACHVHRPAYEELIRFGKSAVPFLIDALHDPDDSIRYMAAYCLGEIKDPAAIPALLEAARDPVNTVGKLAGIALQGLYEENIREPLATTLLDPVLTPGAKFYIALTLAKHGDPRAIDALVAVYERDPKNTLNMFTAALSDIHDPRATAILERLLASPNETIQKSAQWALDRQRGA
jgi:HEAT repeat protein